jgi:hypothetical protein
VKSIGLRADARAAFRVRGVAFDDRFRFGPGASAALFFGF